VILLGETGPLGCTIDARREVPRQCSLSVDMKHRCDGHDDHDDPTPRRVEHGLLFFGAAQPRPTLSLTRESHSMVNAACSEPDSTRGGSTTFCADRLVVADELDRRRSRVGSI
jgi:hypothetical protein